MKTTAQLEKTQRIPIDATETHLRALGINVGLRDGF